MFKQLICWLIGHNLDLNKTATKYYMDEYNKRHDVASLSFCRRCLKYKKLI